MAHKDTSIRYVASYIPKEMLDAIDCEAKKLKLSRASMIAVAIEMYLAAPLLLVRSRDDQVPPAGS